MKNKRLTILIIIAVVAVCLLLVTIALQKNPSRIGTKILPNPTPEQEAPTMMLSFVPNTLTVKPGGKITANIQFDSYGNPVSGVTVAVSYNPTQLKNVTLIPVKDSTSALSYALNLIAGTQTNNPLLGKISETFIVPKSIPAPKGRGIIARFTATLKPGVTSATVKIDSSASASSPALSRVVLGKVYLDIQSK